MSILYHIILRVYEQVSAGELHTSHSFIILLYVVVFKHKYHLSNNSSRFCLSQTLTQHQVYVTIHLYLKVILWMLSYPPLCQKLTLFVSTSEINFYSSQVQECLHAFLPSVPSSHTLRSPLMPRLHSTDKNTIETFGKERESTRETTTSPWLLVFARL